MTKQLIALLFAVGIKGNAQDCKAFHTGSFKVTTPDTTILITLTETTETEYDETMDTTMKGTVKWLSDCAYEVTYTETDNPDFKQLIGIKTKVTLLSVKGKKAVCEFDIAGHKKKLEMVKLK